MMKPAEAAAAEPTAEEAAAAALAAQAAAAPTFADGVTPGGFRREQPNGMSLDSIRALAKSKPREFNRRLEAGEITMDQLNAAAKRGR